MSTIGLLHMECDCGAQLYYLGDGAAGPPSHRLLERFEEKLGPGRQAVFTSAENGTGICPYCYTVYELPPADLLQMERPSDPRRLRMWLEGFLQLR